MAASHKTVHVAAIVALALGAGVAMPAACLFPDYTFDLGKGSGGGGAGGMGTTSSTTGTGGATTSSTTTTTTTSSTGGGGSTTSSTSSTTTTTTSSTSGAVCTTMDCSDPACKADFACVPSSPPSGWTGYFALYDGPPAGAPVCTPDFPNSAYVGNGSINVPPASCSACTCTTPSGRTCAVGGTIDVVDAMCGSSVHCGAQVTPPANWTGSCFGINGLGAGMTTCGPQASDCKTAVSGGTACNVAETIGALAITGGTCTASNQTPTLPPVTWGTAGEACNGGTPTGKGCGVGQCLPKPKAPFHGGMCIMHTGDVAQCPAGAFTERHVFYDPAATLEMRSCTACSCGNPAGGTCSATVTVWSANTCTGQIASLHPNTTTGDCVDLSGNPAVAGFSAIFGSPTGGSCPATGGQPQGTATPQSATTFCCVP